MCEVSTGDCFEPECERDRECGIGQICEGGRCLTDTAEDRDQDGVPDLEDSCPDVANADQEDNDGDGQGDACDTDDDNDGIEDDEDNCPLASNEDQTDTDGDGQGDACGADNDGDSIGDDEDNCPLIANEDQTDTDEDGQGDACDADDDGDNDPDDSDCAPLNRNINHNALEACNGLDDDCDGDVDEGSGNDGCQNFYVDGDGDGFGQGNPQCLCAPDGEFVVQELGDCDDDDRNANPDAQESCNDKDDNCDGAIDELWEPEKGTACDSPDDVDQCLGGALVCTEDQQGLRCSDGPEPDSDPEVCDGGDNDCDDVVDEGFALGVECTVGRGACQNTGTTICNPDNAQDTICNVGPLAPGVEMCGDDIDNDCDGRIDEGFDELNDPCTIDTNVGMCREGTFACAGEDLICEADFAPFSVDEICDDQDNDCDGETDEDGQWPDPDDHEPNNTFFEGLPNSGPEFDTVTSLQYFSSSANFHNASDTDTYVAEGIPGFSRFLLCRLRNMPSVNMEARIRVSLIGVQGRPVIGDRSANLSNDEVYLESLSNTNGALPPYQFAISVDARSGIGPCFSTYEVECKFSSRRAW